MSIERITFYLATADTEADLDTPLTTPAEAIKWIFALWKEDRLYHFDEDPAEIISYSTGRPLFEPNECERVTKRVDELFILLDCPFEVALLCSLEHMHSGEAAKIAAILDGDCHD